MLGHFATTGEMTTGLLEQINVLELEANVCGEGSKRDGQQEGVEVEHARGFCESSADRR